MLGMSEAMLVYALGINAEEAVAKEILFSAQIIGYGIAPAAWFIYILRYTGFTRWVTPWLKSSLIGVAALMTVLVATNRFHQLVYSESLLVDGSGGVVQITRLEPAGALYFLYIMIILGTSFLLLFRLLLEARRLYQKQAMVLIIVPFGAMLTAFFSNSGINPIAPYSPVPYFLALNSCLLAWGVYALRLGDVLPVAHERMFDEMLDGVLLIDRRRRLVDLNRTAAQLLDVSIEKALGRELRSISAGLADQINFSPSAAGHSQVVELTSKLRTRQFDTRLSYLLDSDGQMTSCQIWLRDISALKTIEDNLRQALQETETLRQAGLALAAELDLDQVLERVLRYMKQAISFDRAQILLEEKGNCRVGAQAGLPAVELEHTRRVKNNLLVQHLLATLESVCVPVASESHPFAAFLGDGVRSFLAVPLMMNQRFMGCLVLESQLTGRYDASDQLLAEAFASQAAIAIENAYLFQQVREQATTDPLTGLYNRRYFMETAGREMKLADQNQRAVALMLIDLDHFKRVNDTYGHIAGDQVLVRISKACRHQTRSSDIACRYGGEEFAVLLPDADLKAAVQVAERLRQEIYQARVQTRKGEVGLSASIGVAVLNERMQSIEDLIHQADQALYAAKQSGRNCVRFHLPV